MAIGITPFIQTENLFLRGALLEHAAAVAEVIGGGADVGANDVVE